MVETGKIDLAEGTEHADNVSVMLMAFPHLFPPSRLLKKGLAAQLRS
jgi:hypothetical protein